MMWDIQDSVPCGRGDESHGNRFTWRLAVMGTWSPQAVAVVWTVQVFESKWKSNARQTEVITSHIIKHAPNESMPVWPNPFGMWEFTKSSWPVAEMDYGYIGYTADMQCEITKIVHRCTLIQAKWWLLDIPDIKFHEGTMGITELRWAPCWSMNLNALHTW